MSEWRVLPFGGWRADILAKWAQGIFCRPTAVRLVVRPKRDERSPSPALLGSPKEPATAPSEGHNKQTKGMGSAGQLRWSRILPAVAESDTEYASPTAERSDRPLHNL
jgi:hypothetical protein